MITNLWLLSAVTIASALLLTPIVIKIAFKFGFIDQPEARKVHSKPMPRIGGLAVFVAVGIGFLLSDIVDAKVTGILVGAVIILITGLIDDRYQIKALYKLGGQMLAVVSVIGSGLSIEILSVPGVGKFELGIFGVAFTFIWMIGIINAINLIDGLDGLATGVSIIIFATFAYMAFAAGTELILTFSILLMSAGLGFLVYNFNPAKIFLGDTGSMFFGYGIAVLSVLGLYKSVALFSLIVPILILGVPVFDTLFAIIRRRVKGTPVYLPDKAHLHHRLLQTGLSHKRSVLSIYGISILFGLLAISFETIQIRWSIIALIAMLLFLQILAERLKLIETEFRPFILIGRYVIGFNRKTGGKDSRRNSDVINYAIVGMGFIADKHIQAIEETPNAKLIAICDTNEDRLQEAPLGVATFTDLQTMLDEMPEIHAVNICVPSGLHAKLALQVINNKRHVVLEKPMALTSEDAKAIMDATSQAGVKLTVVHPNRYRPAIKELKKVLEHPEAGRVSHANVTVRWNRNQEYYDQAPWRGTKAFDGGVLMNQAIHSLDLLLWMMGPVKAVQGMVTTRFRKIESEDVATALVEFKSGAVAVIEAATTIYPKNLEESLAVFTENGSFKVSGANALYIDTWDASFVTEAEREALKQKIEQDPWGERGHVAIIKSMTHAIQTNTEPEVVGVDGYNPVKLIEAIIDSSEKGTKIYF
ncbi:UDP-N-acetylmuramyl pentapeptide phosphotransferase/UDP-N-acetylglucosamine-1-phosphate transferase/predicted dehydrogenase [Chryseomicrobium aureum]|nr:UDP-N-acetylmuramyl pentapeptide phosphotransferase/UDP-N-acetylglucosamine-1-phosphate transferase/predicted dehydrogenase [Chryseomicrobium aureum]